MAINNLIFIFVFLPVCTGLYYLLKDNFKPLALFVISLLFFAFNSPGFLIIFIILLVANVALGRCINSPKSSKALKTALLVSGIVLDASVLVFYKYIGLILPDTSFAADNSFLSGLLLFPVGLSFFTFKEISYLCDVYTGKIKLGNDATKDILYISFFPQLQSGPISRYSDMEFERSISLVSEGVYRFLTGFCKKVLIADVLSKVTNEIFNADISVISAPYAWLGAICWSLELYYDFSGYSDMAIGISNIFGYKCPENFSYPYTTDSISKFWRKWHITLGSWFRDYIYIPMGGSRCNNKWRVYVNLLVVWLVTGFWHGISLNFFLWGIGYFVLISFEKLTGLPDRFKHTFAKIIYRIFVLFCIILLWVVFRCSDMSTCGEYIFHMLSPSAGNPEYDIRFAYLLKSYGIFIVSGIALSTPIIPFISRKADNCKPLRIIKTIISPVVIFSLFILALSFVSSGINNPFAYANF